MLPNTSKHELCCESLLKTLLHHVVWQISAPQCQSSSQQQADVQLDVHSLGKSAGLHAAMQIDQAYMCMPLRRKGTFLQQCHVKAHNRSSLIHRICRPSFKSSLLFIQ